MACLVLVVRTVNCFQCPSYVSGLYTEYGVVLFNAVEKMFSETLNFILKYYIHMSCFN